MEKIPIYTIGYGNRSIEEFIDLLQKYHIQYLADIRSRPYSKFNPDFSQAALEKRLKLHTITYIFMGDTLGGRPAMFSIKYVGFAEPINKIPAGTLVRVSLARWWRPTETSEERCYLQLSGWYV